jgi:hypothetical protein
LIQRVALLPQSAAIACDLSQRRTEPLLQEATLAIDILLKVGIHCLSLQ